MEFHSLLGLGEDDALQKLKVLEVPERKEYPDSVYLKFYTCGLEILLRNNKVDTLTFFNEEETKTKGDHKPLYRKFSLWPLHERISLDYPIEKVIELLGQPTEKGGGRYVPIWIRYPGLQIEFVDSDWRNANNQIYSVSVYKSEE